MAQTDSEAGGQSSVVVRSGYPAKRAFDIAASLFGLVVLSPVLLGFALAVWLQDRASPFYFGPRLGRGGRPFGMVKLRSMVVNADKSGVSSTASGDMRITAVGRLIRRFKLDELTQLWNVLVGDMSLVGPRPQIASDVAHYTADERRLLSLRPGITDLSSIVFSDEGTILVGSTNADLDYSRLIRPWKIKLGLIYVDQPSLKLDLRLIFATLVAIVDKRRALNIVQQCLHDLGADRDVIGVAARSTPLVAQPLPASLARSFGISDGGEIS